LDWYLAPKSQLKGTVPLDNIYVRQEPEKNTLVIGQYGKPKEFKMKYQGPNPRDEVRRWYDIITLAIDDFKKRKMDNGGENFKIVVDQGNETRDDFVEGNNVEETFTTTTVNTQQQSQPQTPPVQQQQQQQQTTFMNNPQQQQTTFMNNPQPPQVQQTTFVNPQPMFTPPVQQTTFVNPQPMFSPPMTHTFVSPNPYGVQTTMMTPQMTLMCQFCRNSFSGAPVGGLVRCPFCHQVNNLNQPMMTMPMTTFTTIPPFY